MQRLAETFGKQAFGNERAALVWREVKDFDPFWFRRVVDGFIGDSRQAPLVSDFSNAASEERERVWKIEKAQHAKDAKAFFNSTFSDDDRAMMIGAMIKRMMKQMPDSEWVTFTGMLQETVKLSQPVRCAVCEDAGILFETNASGVTSILKCTCEAGKKDRRRFPVIGGAL